MDDEIKTVPFITNIPQSTIALKITATIFVDGELHTAITEINSADAIREGMLKGEEWDEEHARWFLTDEVRKELGLGEDNET